jgi:hypothetical protein
MVDASASLSLLRVPHLDPRYRDRVRPMTGRAAGCHPAGGARWRACRGLAAVVLAAVLAAGAVMAAMVSAAGPAAAIGTGGTGAFSLTPAPAANGTSPPYFMLTLGAGQSARATVILGNLSTASEQLRLSRSTGTTAANGGSAFTLPARCSGAGCWVAGLPVVRTLAAGAKVRMGLTVVVPRGTKPGQYLAGVTAGLAQPPTAGPVAGGHGAKAVIIEQVTVGVAITVGKLSALATRLAIPAVQAGAVGSLHRLEITLSNTGQTFTGGSGTASCTSGGKAHAFAIYASTVLPGGRAVIPVNVSGLSKGTSLPCKVTIHYGKAQTVTWTGRVTLSSTAKELTAYTGPGAYSVLPSQGTPAWAMALIALGALVLAVGVVLLNRTRRRTTAR